MDNKANKIYPNRKKAPNIGNFEQRQYTEEEIKQMGRDDMAYLLAEYEKMEQQEGKN